MICFFFSNLSEYKTTLATAPSKLHRQELSKGWLPTLMRRVSRSARAMSRCSLVARWPSTRWNLSSNILNSIVFSLSGWVCSRWVYCRVMSLPWKWSTFKPIYDFPTKIRRWFSTDLGRSLSDENKLQEVGRMGLMMMTVSPSSSCQTLCTSSSTFKKLKILFQK